MSPLSDPIVDRLKRSASLANAGAVVLALAALAGWAADLSFLRQFGPGWPPVRPACALALVAGAVILELLQRTLPARRGPLIVATAVAGICTIAMAGVPAVAAVLPGGGMSTFVALPFLLILSAIVCAYAPRPWSLRAARWLASAAGIILFIALIAASFRLLLAARPPVDISLVSLAGFMMLCWSVLAGQPDPWLVQRLVSQRPGAIITRRLLPPILLLPLVLSWVRIMGQEAALFDTASGSLLLTVLTIFAFGVLVLWGANAVDRLDRQRSEAEQQANAQREWLRVTISSCEDAVVAVDPGGAIRLVNHAAEILIGRRKSELEHHPVEAVFPVSDNEVPDAGHPLRGVLERGTGPTGYRDLSLVHADGTTRIVEVSVAPIHGADGALHGGVMVLRDVSARRQEEHALREAYRELDSRVAERTAALERANDALHDSLALFRGVAESTPDLIYVKDREGRLVMANPATIRALGRQENELLGRTDLDHGGDPADAMRVMENDRRVMSSGRVERIEEVMKTPEGPRTFLSTKSPLRDVHGAVIGLIGVATDITDRKRMENELREAQRFTQGLLETAPIILYLFDLDQRRVVYASGMGLSAMGYEANDIQQMTPDELQNAVHPEDVVVLSDHLNSYANPHAGLREVEFRYRRGDGAWRWLHCREKVFEPGGRLILGVGLDTTDRKEAELGREHLVAAEKRLRVEAELANRAKDEFLAIVSHELRSPLNALRGWGFLLGNAKPLDPSLIERATQAIKRNVDHQARLIDDLLDTSRIMSGKLTLERRPVNLHEIVHAAMEVVRAAAVAKRITMEVESPEAAYPIEGDPARLHQIAVNLLSNAVKFTPEGGRVKVSLSCAGEKVRMAVTDTGLGIEREFLPRVFERFSQADTSTTRKHGGLGIGLALVRHLSELHGGRVTAHSEGQGKGATFTVELPLRRDPETTPGDVSDSLPALAAGGLSGTRICALDDDADARDIIALTLRQAGADVRTVGTGAELIAMLDEQLPDRRPDVLLMDLAMPNEDGFTVLAQVRALEGRKAVPERDSIPAIAVTAFTELNRSHVLKQGFIDQVSKPIDAGKLVASIRRALDGHQRAA